MQVQKLCCLIAVRFNPYLQINIHVYMYIVVMYHVSCDSHVIVYLTNQPFDSGHSQFRTSL